MPVQGKPAACCLLLAPDKQTAVDSRAVAAAMIMLRAISFLL
jgi:hypothetical protein